MIERRLFDELPHEDLGRLKARRHFSSTAQGDPSPSGWGRMRVEFTPEMAPRSKTSTLLLSGQSKMQTWSWSMFSRRLTDAEIFCERRKSCQMF
jgi:hypothetical protein